MLSQFPPPSEPDDKAKTTSEPQRRLLSRRQFLGIAIWGIAALGSGLSPSLRWVRQLFGGKPSATLPRRAPLAQVDDPQRWFLHFKDASGRPWGDETAMAKRYTAAPPNDKPWDEGCKVMPIVGGYATMRDIRETFRQAIALAKASGKPMGDDRGYVYITDWRLNPLRDISDQNEAWQAQISEDPTVMGWILKLMQAGVRVRVMVWTPVFVARGAGFGSHINDHVWLAKTIQAENDRLMGATSGDPYGMMALDMRVTDLAIPTATHHQKMVVVRVNTPNGNLNVAYVGGVDFAYTRRDAPRNGTPFDPAHPKVYGGDWQSGSQIPAPSAVSWPQETGSVDYTSVAKKPDGEPPNDLDIAGGDVYGTEYQLWHDQHLRLEGPIVDTIDAQFSERWCDTTALVDEEGVRYDAIQRVFSLDELGGNVKVNNNQVIFSTKRAFDANLKIYKPITQYPASAVSSTVGSSKVQMWRTIPMRPGRSSAPFMRGEYTVMGGIANACKAAQELIWIFDQYFWSRALGELLYHQLETKPSLHIIIILPPHADTQASVAHHARKLALQDLYGPTAFGYASRIRVYSLWHPARQLGIYCHAKTQMYDGQLLVCGSANLNRRSFLCDTELDCAVLDHRVVGAHQKALWEMLFTDVPYPSDVDLTTQGSGTQFFQRFTQAAPQSFGDAPISGRHLFNGPISPNDIVHLPSKNNTEVGELTFYPAFAAAYNGLLDPFSLHSDPQTDLADWVSKIEDPKTRDKWRKL